MLYVALACSIISLVAYYIVYLLGKKSGRQERIIEEARLKNYNEKKDRKRYDENMDSDISVAIDSLRQNSDTDI